MSAVAGQAAVGMLARVRALVTCRAGATPGVADRVQRDHEEPEGPDVLHGIVERRRSRQGRLQLDYLTSCQVVGGSRLVAGGATPATDLFRMDLPVFTGPSDRGPVVLIKGIDACRAYTDRAMSELDRSEATLLDEVVDLASADLQDCAGLGHRQPVRALRIGLIRAHGTTMPARSLRCSAADMTLT